jgi:hypothetical protein
MPNPKGGSSKIDLPMTGGDLGDAPDRDEKPSPSARRWSGSSNREGGHDLHPHAGDHGEAQGRGSPDEADYNGTD